MPGDVSNVPAVPLFAHTGFKGCFHDFGREWVEQPVTFVWIATSPTGRQSVHWKTRTFYGKVNTGRLKYAPRHKQRIAQLARVYTPTKWHDATLADLAAECAKCILPRLRAGYTWHGPFLYEDCRQREPFGWRGGHWFLKHPPTKSDGTPVRYIASFPSALPIAA